MECVCQLGMPAVVAGVRTSTPLRYKEGEYEYWRGGHTAIPDCAVRNLVSAGAALVDMELPVERRRTEVLACDDPL